VHKTNVKTEWELLQGGHRPGKLGKLGEFKSRLEKVWENSGNQGKCLRACVL